MIHVISSPRVADWVAKHISDADILGGGDFGNSVSFGVMIDKRPIFGVVWSDYRQMRHGNDIRCTIAATSPRWCTRGVLRELFSYPFHVAKCARITAVIREGNDRSLKLCKGLGFEREGTIRRGYNGKSNAIVLGMLKDQCRWLD